MDMKLKRDSRQTVVARVESDPAFSCRKPRRLERYIQNFGPAIEARKCVYIGFLVYECCQLSKILS